MLIHMLEIKCQKPFRVLKQTSISQRGMHLELGFDLILMLVHMLEKPN